MRKFFSLGLRFVGFGILVPLVLFLVFLFPLGTSSGSVYGLWLIGLPLGVIGGVALALGYALRPNKNDDAA